MQPYPGEWNEFLRIVQFSRAATELHQRLADVVVKCDGSVFWVTHRIYESSCIIDLSDYPFDQQRCDLWFQSLTHSGSELRLDIYLPGFDLETQLTGFQESDQWEITSNTSEVVSSPATRGEILVFSRRRSIRLQLGLKRRPGFTAYILTVPCVVLSGMTLIVFLLPQERPDRHMIGLYFNIISMG